MTTSRAPTPTKGISFKTVADTKKDFSFVDLLDMDDMELESIDTAIASVAVSALLKETSTQFSAPKHLTSMATGSQPPPKEINLGLS